jgi:hypothetical protein
MGYVFWRERVRSASTSVRVWMKDPEPTCTESAIASGLEDFICFSFFKILLALGR